MVLRQENLSLQLHQGLGKKKKKTTEEKSGSLGQECIKPARMCSVLVLPFLLTNGQPNYTFTLGWLSANTREISAKRWDMRGSQEGSSSPPLL